jgi:hypothetical protein
MARLVLTDASPLIALSRVDGLCWLERIFGQVAPPPEIHDEVLPGRGFADEEKISPRRLGRGSNPNVAVAMEQGLSVTGTATKTQRKARKTGR